MEASTTMTMQGFAATAAAPRPARRGAPPPLGNPQRVRIYDLIRAEPGIHLHGVRARIGLSWGTTVYHLDVLRRAGLVVAERHGRHLHHFATGDPAARHWEAVAVMRHPTARAIAELVQASPGVHQKVICTQLAITPSLASWHLGRLRAAGAVDGERAGRHVRYRPGPALLALAMPAVPAAPAIA
ncbi:MAG TPA: hypothetical protein VGR28_05285 [Candidatus Thermoplasmatota archaeon]|jgi:predicted transcriptional regulator|nr:hypothetical protein [Candidatus Thermoplasmatota archaeon]